MIELVYARVHINLWLRKLKIKLPYLLFGVIIYLVICANILSTEKGGAKMAGESLMGIAKDLTVAVLGQLSTSGGAEVYGQRIGRLYRAVLREVELGRSEILTTRGVEPPFLSSESTEPGEEE